TVERNRGLFHHFVGGRRSAGQKAWAKPPDHIVGGNIVSRDNDHATAPSGTDPVFYQPYGLCGSCASCVDLRVGTAGANEFGELRMSHRQDSEQEAPVEDIGIFLDSGAQLLDATVQFRSKAGMTISHRLDAQALQYTQLVATGMVHEIARHDFDEGVVTGKSRAENHASVIAHGVRQAPTVR